MKKIKIHDKFFEPFIPFEKIDAAIGQMADKINSDMAGKTPLFLVILNGSFMFAADLFKKLDMNCEISFIKLASYSGTQSTENVKELIGLDESFKDRHVIIVEDIIDSGITLEMVLNSLKEMDAASVQIATLLFKPKAFRKDYTIEYIGLEIPNDFIVGYGLDYDKQGRNYKDIYKIVE
ncbi:MAG: hypoxanthine phosphoribosyltransferase [Bacteroidales bacterium]|nr:hypoxanthine phosphoribosyltransferase [Bacteroidales bacterium]MCF6341984.1 hypoxanthine phosphoribosyltransferase [Bacteroidales bacterium]